MNICFFEDGGDRFFAPLTLTRPVDDLRIGIFTIREKWAHYLPVTSVARLPRMPVVLTFPGDHNDTADHIFWINARWLPDRIAADEVKHLKPGDSLAYEGTVVAACLTHGQSRKHFEQKTLPAHQNSTTATRSGTLLSALEDLFLNNEEEIKKDTSLISGSRLNPDMFPQTFLIQPENIIAEEGVVIDPGVFIDASHGPVFLGRNARVMFGAAIEGPGAVCRDSVIKMGAKIYAGSTIGPSCKVSGEIYNVIMQSFSNKAHDGFIGNSLIGEWCNLGANTTTSNLKNNYKPITLPEWTTGRNRKTTLQFFGTVMGDHSKTAINTSLSAGTLCGICCQIFMNGFPPKYIPSFSWMSPDRIQLYEFEKAIETAETMMKRRNVPLNTPYRDMMRYLFENRESVD